MAPTRSTWAKLRRPVLGLAGQVLNAGTNVATAFLASYLLQPDGFGLFVLAYAVVTIVLASGRGLVGTTLLSHLPWADAARRRELTASAFGFTIAVGLAVTVAVAAVAVVLPPLLAFVPWIVAALVQDAGRHVFLAEGRTGAALVLDVAWAVAQAALLAVWILAGGTVTVDVVAAAWGVGALAGAVAFVALARVRPRRPGLWTRTTRDVAGWFTGAAVVGQCEVYVVLLLAGTLLAPVDAGGLRAVQLVALQPAVVVLGALLVLATPTFARLGPDTPAAELTRASARVLVSVLPVVVLILLVVPVRIPLMSLLLPQYLAFAPLVLPTALQAVTIALSVPALALLRGLRRGALFFWLQVTRIVLVVGATLAGLAGAGVLGVAWAQAAGGALSLATMAWAARRIRSPRAVPVGVAGDRG